MDWIFQNELIMVAFTVAIYFMAQLLQSKVGIIILNPTLISLCIIICVLLVFKVDYEAYHKGARYIEFFLKPAIVALGVPLYYQLEKIKKQAVLIVVSQLVGCVVGIVSVVVLAKLMGASKEIIISLAPKSVTTPIAIEVSKTIGGITPITASVVVVVGVFGAVFGYSILQIAKVKNPIAQSLSIGNTTHALGTSKSMEISANYGAMSSIGLILNGIFTAVLTPYILKVLGFVMAF